MTIEKRPSLRKCIDDNCKYCIYDPLAAGTWRQQVTLCAVTACPLYRVRPTTPVPIPESVLDYYQVTGDERAFMPAHDPKKTPQQGMTSPMVGKVVGYHPNVPEGTYTVNYCGYETGRSWNSKKVKLHFAIVEGEFAGVPLARYYNAKHLSEPVGPNGDFDVGDRSYLVKEFRSLLPDVRSISEIDLDLYRDKLIRAQVEATNKTGTGESLSESNQYSVIRKLLEIVPESYESESLTKLG